MEHDYDSVHGDELTIPVGGDHPGCAKTSGGRMAGRRTEWEQRNVS